MVQDLAILVPFLWEPLDMPGLRVTGGRERAGPGAIGVGGAYRNPPLPPVVRILLRVGMGSTVPHVRLEMLSGTTLVFIF